MSEGRKNIQTYSSEDIRKYLEGGMTPAEMHAIEKAALDDPFLADAIEGMEHSLKNDPATFQQDITDLKQRIDNRVNKRSKVIVFNTYWKAAAIVLVLSTAVALVLFMNKNTGKEELVLAKVEDRKDSLMKRSEQSSAATESQAPADMLDTSPSPATARERSLQPAISKKEEEKAGRAVAPVAPLPELAETHQKDSIVKDEKADVTANTQRQITSNRNESYKALEGKTPGISVDSNADIEEVVVTGYSAKNRKVQRYSGESVTTKNMDQIVPEGGWSNFDDYLNINKHIAGKDSSLSGKEIISFVIDQDGRPKNFKIRKSLSAAHDAESIRLIENGPKWEVVKDRKRKVRLEIIF